MLYNLKFQSLAVLALLLWTASAVRGDAPPPGGPATGRFAFARHVAEADGPCTVGIHSTKADTGGYYGSGAVITPDGYILTSTTVVPVGGSQIKVYFGDLKELDATAVETVPALEAVLLKVEGKNLPYFRLAKELPEVGQRAFTFANVQDRVKDGFRPIFSMGTISGYYEVQNFGGESGYQGPAIEPSAAVNPGSDGGPIINQNGQLCAILSMNFSLRRWQGVGVPITEIVHRMDSFKSGKVKVNFEPLAPASADADLESLTRYAEKISKYLVGITVDRKVRPEVLPRANWDEFQRKIKGWDKLSAAEKTARQGVYDNLERLLEANQMVRRPAAALTGIVVSADGLILTSSFNVGDDVFFKDKTTGKLQATEFRDGTTIVIPDAKTLAPDKNSIEKITVTLPDGTQHVAKLLAHHEPLGVALLKIDAKDLKYCNLEKATGAPELGTPLGLVGFVGGALTRYTLNTGIVSAAERAQGMRFQTDALLNYGNSGGPVISARGQLLGIALAPIKPQTVLGRVFSHADLTKWATAPNSGVSMICRADQLLPALADLKAGKSLTSLPGQHLGIAFDPRQALGEQLIIARVMPDSPAQKAGVKAGDHIAKVDGKPLTSWKEFTERVKNVAPGGKVELELHRKDIVNHLMINGQKVENEADLHALLQKLKPGEKFEGSAFRADIKTVTLTVGEVK